MTPKVFCKDCKWFKEYYSESSPHVLLDQQCKIEPYINPITGEPYDEYSYRLCEVANQHCNCPDYEPNAP